jgi:alkylated DNA repair dioxygenase AlkB
MGIYREGRQRIPTKQSKFDSRPGSREHGKSYRPPRASLWPVSNSDAELMAAEGATVVTEWVDQKAERELLLAVDAAPWRGDLLRRTQHYGWRYDYKARRVDASMHLGALPSWAASLTRRILEERRCEHEPDQVIVNEYVPGQGIASHVDCVACFGPTILSLSLGSTCAMEFTRPQAPTATLVLPTRGLLVLSDDARYRWAHRVPARKSDVVSGVRLARSRRISLTFRTVRLEAE